MDSSNDSDREPETTKKMRGDDSRSEDADDDLQMTSVDKLCEDELTWIFSNSWLSTQDLLNLRLVNKTWRDAATTTLRRRDACVVELYGDSNQDPPCFYKDGGKKTDENELSQLTEIFSKSNKFPSTNFRIRIVLDTLDRYTHFPDLLHFFKLHGDKVKTLGPHDWITSKRLLDIILINAPDLEHLDLSKAKIKAPRQGKDRDANALKWTLETLAIKSLTLSEFRACDYFCGVHYNIGGLRRAKSKPFRCDGSATDQELLHSFLLSSSPKLGRIENVTLESLGMVLAQGRGHLIRSFKCILEKDSDYMFEDQDEDNKLLSASFKEFVTLNPKLTKLTLRFDCWEDKSPPKEFITSLNGLLKSSKNTLQTLKISLTCTRAVWGLLLSIPQMQKLKSLTLRFKNYFELLEFKEITCRRCGKDAKTYIDLREGIFKFEDGISAQNYFPSLMEVAVDSRDSDIHEFSPMSFFSFKLNADTDRVPDNWNCLPKVDILEINKIELGSKPISCRSCQPLRKPLLFLEVFPNIRILKFEFGKVSNLSNHLWTFCPNVEFMEIYRISSCSSGGRDVQMSCFVDKVFTGFSDQMLENLQESAAGLSCAVNDSEECKPKPAPTTPSISDLRHLKELKLKFVGKWSTEFASSVTGLYAFSKVKNTKFIISYDPEKVLGLKNQDRAKVSCSDNDEEEDDSSDSDDDSADDENTGDKNIGDDDDWKEIDEDIDAASDIADSDDDNDGADLQDSDVENDDDGDENTSYDNDGKDDGRNQIVANIDEANDSEENGDDKIAKYEEIIFGPLKPYVHIVHERQKYYMWDD